MKKNKHVVHIEGYWLLENLKSIPNLGGIFFIYQCQHDVVEDTLEIKNLLYIGRSKQIPDEIKEVLQMDKMKECMLLDQQLCVSYAAILDEDDRESIFKQYLHIMRPAFNQINESEEREMEDNILISIGDVALLEPVYDNYVFA